MIAGRVLRAEPKGSELAAGGEKANALGLALRPFLTLAERHGRNNSRGGHERKENQSDEKIMHGGSSNPLVYRLRNPGKQPKLAE